MNIRLSHVVDVLLLIKLQYHFQTHYVRYNFQIIRDGSAALAESEKFGFPIGTQPHNNDNNKQRIKFNCCFFECQTSVQYALVKSVNRIILVARRVIHQ